MVGVLALVCGDCWVKSQVWYLSSDSIYCVKQLIIYKINISANFKKDIIICTPAMFAFGIFQQ